MEGGYLMVNLADNELFQRLQIGKDLGKPILVRDGSQNFFIDRITGGLPIYDEDDILTGYTDIVLTSAIGTITITDANVVTKTDLDNVIYPLMENIKDASGNLRFVEGDGTPQGDVEGRTITYCKWSLSGTHLMCVVAMDIVADTTFSDICYFDIPSWIYDKIIPSSWENVIQMKKETFLTDDFTARQVDYWFRKSSTPNRIYINLTNSQTFTKDISLRMQFDLLIDNEDGE